MCTFYIDSDVERKLTFTLPSNTPNANQLKFDSYTFVQRFQTQFMISDTFYLLYLWTKICANYIVLSKNII